MKIHLGLRSCLPIILLAFAFVLMLAPAPAEAMPCEVRCYWGPSPAACGCYTSGATIITCNQWWNYGCPARVASPPKASETGLGFLNLQGEEGAPFTPMNPIAESASLQRPLEAEDSAAAARVPDAAPQEAPLGLGTVEQPAALELD